MKVYASGESVPQPVGVASSLVSLCFLDVLLSDKSRCKLHLSVSLCSPKFFALTSLRIVVDKWSQEKKAGGGVLNTRIAQFIR